MADAPLAFPVEQIPDPDSVFLHVHSSRMNGGNPTPGAFTPHGEGLSVDWEIYSTAVDTRGRARKPAENGVIRLVAGEIRKLDVEGHGHLDVIHRPLAENRAYSEVPFPKPERGDSWTEARLLLNRIAKVEVQADIPFRPAARS